MLHGAETWVIPRVLENKMDTAEIRISRWTAEVTRRHKTRSSYDSGCSNITETRQGTVNLVAQTKI